MYELLDHKLLNFNHFFAFVFLILNSRRCGLDFRRWFRFYFHPRSRRRPLCDQCQCWNASKVFYDINYYFICKASGQYQRWQIAGTYHPKKNPNPGISWDPRKSKKIPKDLMHKNIKKKFFFVSPTLFVQNFFAIFVVVFVLL